jgi:DNA polymerase-3 subunit epsilon
LYTVIDIETTGGTSKFHKIIEIAIVTHDGQKPIDRYSTLINPERPIPNFITSLTGISNEMVEHAPTFSEVADNVFQKTEGKVFVAHNVNFDYGFLKKSFDDVGIRFERKKLCTVRLAKKIFAGFPTYSLGALTSQLGIEIEDRHRALGDADATAELFGLLLENDRGGFIAHSLNRKSREATLPAHLSKATFDTLPEQTGVYYFHDRKGKVVYIGKAKNIKSRIAGHFTSDSSKSKRLFHEKVHDISYELTGNELIALLVESHEIKRLWPEFNRAQKFAAANFGLFQYTDRNGYQRLTISKVPPRQRAMINFGSMREGRQLLQSLVRRFNLCPKLCGLQKTVGACYDVKIGICDGACEGAISTGQYNERIAQAMAEVKQEMQTYAIIGPGRELLEQSVVLVENGSYLGHGFTDHALPAVTFDELKDRIMTFADNQDIQRILNMHIRKPNGYEVIYF